MAPRIRRWTEKWISVERHKLLNGIESDGKTKKPGERDDLHPVAIGLFYFAVIFTCVTLVWWTNGDSIKFFFGLSTTQAEQSAQNPPQ